MGGRFLSLFVSPEEKRHRLRDIRASARALAEKLEGKFVVFVGLSLSLHALIFGLLVLQPHSRASIPAARLASDDMAISRAMAEMAKRVRTKVPRSEKAFSLEAAEAIAGDLGKLFEFDPGISDNEKTEIFLKLMELSLELGEGNDSPARPDPEKMKRLIDLLRQRKSVKLGSGDTFIIAEPSPDGAYGVYKLDHKSSDMLGRLKEEANKGRTAVASHDGMVDVAGANGPKSIPEEYFFKTAPGQEMTAMGAQVFTVFRGFPIFQDKRSGILPKEQPPVQKMSSPDDVLAPGFIYLLSRRPFRQNKTDEPVLKLVEEDRRRILDELMEFKESEQLDIFKKRYLDRYDLDQEDLAVLTREFLFSNMNNVFFITGSFSLAFDFVEEVFYKRAAYDLFASYGSRFAGTRTGKEILFYLASAYDFERRALEKLVLSRRDALGILAGRQGTSGIYQPVIKAFALNLIYRDVTRLAADMNLTLDSLLDQYVRREEEIYEMLVDFGGEAKNRALNAWGRLLWSEGKLESAVAKWKQVDFVYPLSSPAYWKSMQEINRFGLVNIVARIDEILSTESTGDRRALLERHLQFHTWRKRAH